MKHILLTSIGLLLFISMQAQSKRKLRQRIDSLTVALYYQEQRINDLEKSSDLLQRRLFELPNVSPTVPESQGSSGIETMEQNTVQKDALRRKQQTMANLSQSNASSPAGFGQCKAITKKGNQCTRSAGKSGYCWQHGKGK